MFKLGASIPRLIAADQAISSEDISPVTPNAIPDSSELFDSSSTSSDPFTMSTSDHDDIDSNHRDADQQSQTEIDPIDSNEYGNISSIVVLSEVQTTDSIFRITFRH